MERLRFMKAATLSGWALLVELSNQIGALALLLGVLGISIYSFVQLPWWVGLLILLIAYFVLFAEGAFQTWRDVVRAAPVLTAGKRPLVRSTYPEALARAERRIDEGFALADKLRSLQDPAAISSLFSDLSDWDDGTYEDMEAYTDAWAVQFGDNAFAEELPTDKQRLQIVLGAKLARLHNLIGHEYPTGRVFTGERPELEVRDVTVMGGGGQYLFDVRRRGETLERATIRLLIPKTSGRVLRLEGGGVANGHYRDSDEELIPGVSSIYWEETGVTFSGYDTANLYRFVFPIPKDVEEWPYRFSIAAKELGGWKNFDGTIAVNH